jgi:autotransporter translocation and assembly factor TamB
MASVRAARIALLALIACALGLFAAAAWVFYSTSGLQWLAARGVGLSGGHLQIHGVDGTLSAGARVSAIEFSTGDLSVRVRQARFALSPWSLLTLSAQVEDLGAERIEVKTKPSGEARSPLPDSIALPIDILLRNARIGTLVLDDAARMLELSDVHLEYAGG